MCGRRCRERLKYRRGKVLWMETTSRSSPGFAGRDTVFSCPILLKLNPRETLLCRPLFVANGLAVLNNPFWATENFTSSFSFNKRWREMSFWAGSGDNSWFTVEGGTRTIFLFVLSSTRLPHPPFYTVSHSHMASLIFLFHFHHPLIRLMGPAKKKKKI